MKRRAAVALLVLAGMVAAVGAEAKVHIRGHFTDDSGRVVGQVRVNRMGVHVVSTDRDSLFDELEDSDTTFGGAIVIDDGGAGMVRIFSDAHVPAGEHIDGDVVAVFGSVRVDGEVTGDVVSVFGTLELGPTAVVGGDAVAVGGGGEHAPGSRVNGQSVSLSFIPVAFGWPTLPFLLVTIVFGWLVSVLFGWLLALVFPERLVRVAETASRRTGVSFLLGVVSLPLFMVLMVLLFVTVIGIPIALLLPIVYIIIWYFGQIACTYLLGCRLTRRRQGETSIMWPVMAGTLFVAAFFAFGALLWIMPGIARPVAVFFHLLGLLLVVALSTVGTGAFLLSRAGDAPAPVGAAVPSPSGGVSAGPIPVA